MVDVEEALRQSAKLMARLIFHLGPEQVEGSSLDTLYSKASKKPNMWPNYSALNYITIDCVGQFKFKGLPIRYTKEYELWMTYEGF